MKVTFAVIVLSAFVAYVSASPLPQNRPILDAISSAASSTNQMFSDAASYGYNAMKQGAETTGRFIGSAADTFSSGIQSAGQTINNVITRPFQSQVQSEVESE